ncbi:nitroreductase family deazaflavin-dependent oxidoreductase [Streptomonospora nanhaiensis]|nr:nitroreductase family deazaflavin-dependent oxidoreductase [Streptomonospora nanhaiensis]
MPRWWVHLNRRVFNPRAIASGKWPVLVHVGRVSGATYRTPLDACPVEGGYLFVPVYGARSDWVRNVLAAGGARLRVDGREVALTAPRIVGEDEAFAALAPTPTARPGSCASGSSCAWTRPPAGPPPHSLGPCTPSWPNAASWCWTAAWPPGWRTWAATSAADCGRRGC